MTNVAGRRLLELGRRLAEVVGIPKVVRSLTRSAPRKEAAPDQVLLIRKPDGLLLAQARPGRHGEDWSGFAVELLKVVMLIRTSLGVGDEAVQRAPVDHVRTGTLNAYIAETDRAVIVAVIRADDTPVNILERLTTTLAGIEREQPQAFLQHADDKSCERYAADLERLLGPDVSDRIETA